MSKITKQETTHLKSKTSRMMAELVDQGGFIDCGEVQCTELAEYVAEAMGYSFWLDDSTHWIWELPILLDAHR